jgi:hypothetical protein
MCPDCDRFSKLSRLGTLKILNDRQDIAEHEHKVWQKSSNIFTSFALKVRRQKRGNNFCAFKQRRLRSESRFRPNEAWMTWPTQTFAETCGNLRTAQTP